MSRIPMIRLSVLLLAALLSVPGAAPGEEIGPALADVGKVAVAVASSAEYLRAADAGLAEAQSHAATTREVLGMIAPGDPGGAPYILRLRTSLAPLRDGLASATAPLASAGTGIGGALRLRSLEGSAMKSYLRRQRRRAARIAALTAGPWKERGRRSPWSRPIRAACRPTPTAAWTS